MCARVYSELEKKEDIYHSMLAEAYFVLLLYTVVELYGKPSADVEEDYRCGPGGEGWLGEGGYGKPSADVEEDYRCRPVGRMAGGVCRCKGGGWQGGPQVLR